MAQILNAVQRRFQKMKGPSFGQTAASTAGSTLAGAGAGAAVGSIVPGVGNVVGGAIGGAIGLAKGLFGGAAKNKQVDEQNAVNLEKANKKPLIETSGDNAILRKQIQQASEPQQIIREGMLAANRLNPDMRSEAMPIMAKAFLTDLNQRRG